MQGMGFKEEEHLRDSQVWLGDDFPTLLCIHHLQTHRRQIVRNPTSTPKKMTPQTKKMVGIYTNTMKIPTTTHLPWCFVCFWV